MNKLGDGFKLGDGSRWGHHRTCDHRVVWWSVEATIRHAII